MPDAPSMIERVARRLFWQHDGKYAERGMPTWESLDDLTRDSFLKDARAAIDEMREPTDAMVEAGDKDTRDWASAETAYRAMIDAAISDDGK